MPYQTDSAEPRQLLWSDQNRETDGTLIVDGSLAGVGGSMCWVCSSAGTGEVLQARVESDLHTTAAFAAQHTHARLG